MVTDGLIDWYHAARRDLPWRRDRDAYRVWVSEIMLQQTRVEAVIPYYERFLTALPDVQTLADADEELLLKLWEGLGYYSRVRNMQKAAKQILELGRFPETAQELKKLSGFGEYTAGAVASIAFGQRAAAVDGNVLRVWSRMECVGESISVPSVRRACASAVLEAMPPDCYPGDYTQALMELGATICTPKSPKCEKCPLRAHCGAHAEGEQEEYPVKAPEITKKVERFTVVLIVEDGKILVRKRPRTGLLAGLWEFPHHVDNARETADAPEVRHIFTHKIWEMRGAWAEKTGDIAGEWVDSEALAALPMPTPMEKYRKYVLESGVLQACRS